jgi:hypothetical protein
MCVLAAHTGESPATIGAVSVEPLFAVVVETDVAVVVHLRVTTSIIGGALGTVGVYGHRLLLEQFRLRTAVDAVRE